MRRGTDRNDDWPALINVRYCGHRLAVWPIGNGVVHINEVALRRARLVLRSVTVHGCLGM